MARQTIRFCTAADGVRLAYAAVGRGPPLVKAANWLTHVEFDWQTPLWRSWIDALAEKHTYIRYDTRGCGLSDREPAEVSFESWVRDLETVVDACQLERFALLGMSQGAATAIAYAVRHPERVSHLILYGGFARGRLKRGLGDKAIEELLLYCKLAQIGWGTDDAAFRQFFTSQFMPDGTAEQFAAFNELQRVSASAEQAVKSFQVASQVDVSEAAPRVACPTLVVHARGDRRVPFEEGRLMASLIPNARFVPLESRNHVLFENESAFRLFREELDAFLRGGADRDVLAALTARERQLLELLARGLDNHQIAAHLELSEKTVRNQVSSVFAKIGVESRAQAIVKAREAGYGVGSAA
jgi:pimeloyl-ACP methyl ester carboxylesterase/DNA-binding CsgD family transcriptional regulator